MTAENYFIIQPKKRSSVRIFGIYHMLYRKDRDSNVLLLRLKILIMIGSRRLGEYRSSHLG